MFLKLQLLQILQTVIMYITCMNFLMEMWNYSFVHFILPCLQQIFNNVHNKMLDGEFLHLHWEMQCFMKLV